MSPTKVSQQFVKAMAALRFQRREGGFAWQQNGTRAALDGRWLRVSTAETEIAAGTPRGMLGRPGLWTRQEGVHDGCAQLEFAVPTSVLMQLGDEDDTGAEAANAVADFVRWALATAKGKPPEGWTPPPRPEIEGWMKPGALTIQTGPHLMQAELIHAPDRLALRCAVVRIPNGLPAARRAWLRHMFSEAVRCWRLVRVGFEEAPPGQRGLVEVDFTGAPPSLLGEPLLSAGLDAVRWVAQWLADPAALVVDTDVVCHAIECCSPPATPGSNHRKE
jgi:hypothetical protein